MSKAVSMKAQEVQAQVDAKNVQDVNEGAPNNVPYWWGHQPIYLQSRSQKVKSKVLAKRNSNR